MVAQSTVRLPEGGPTVALSIHLAIKNKEVPDKADYGYGWRPVKAKLADVVKHISNGGAISVGYIKSDHRTTDNFVSADIIGLDFDHGKSSVQELLKDPFIRKHAFMVYATVSSTKEHPRSRALFKLDRSVTSAEEYRKLVLVLLSKYQIEADQFCKDPVRIFYGSTKRDRHVDLTKTLPIKAIQAEAAGLPSVNTHVSKNGAAADLARILSEGSERGSRDNDAIKLVGSLVNVATPDVTEAVCKLWYDQKVLDKRDFPFSKVQDMVTRMSTKAAPVRSEVVNLLKGRQQETLIAEARTINFLDFIGQEDEDITWAVDGWLPDNTTGLMVAPPGTYKTWLALAMGMSIATGMSFCGRYPVRKQGRVLVVQQEDSKNILRQRMKTIGAELIRQFMASVSKDDMLNPNLFTFLSSPALDMYVSDETLRLDNPRAMANFRKLLEKTKYDLVILDPLYAIGETDDYMAKSAQKMIEFKRMRDAFGTSFLVLHHTKKSAENSATINRMDAWGSQLMNAWLEVGIQIRPVSPTDDKQIRVLRHFKSSGEANSEILKFDICTRPDERRFKIEVKESVANATVNNGEVDLVAMLRQYGPLKNNEIAARAGVHASTITRKLNQLIKSGDIVRHDDDKSYSVAGLDVSF